MISRHPRRTRPPAFHVLVLLGVSVIVGCRGEEIASDAQSAGELSPPPPILLVTLDTIRADRLGIEDQEIETPHLTALAERGLYFAQAYATVPMTLPAHTSMFTGLYPAQHGIHENGRFLPEELSLLAEELQARGYETAAVVSGYPLSREFGVASGFDEFDDDFGGDAVERDAAAATDRALALLEAHASAPFFLWVHYFDPHEPYDPPEPFRSEYAADPYQGEIAFMDRELGRLFDGFEAWAGQRKTRIVVVGDHGEGLGDHGETLHGRLAYQGVMRVPLIVAGSDVLPGRVEDPVSTKDAFATIVGWAEGDEQPGWLSGESKPVLGEALKPYLQYGWRPQVMGVKGAIKVIRSGETEVYDVRADPRESENLAGAVELDRELAEAIRDYPIAPASGTSEVETLSEEAIRKLASLGYFDSGSGRPERENAPNPRDMTHVFRDLDLGSSLFVERQYARAIPVFSRVLEADPENLEVALRLAVANSVLGNEREAQRFFERARNVSPGSVDVRHYHAMHYFRFGHYDEALPLFESVLAEMPNRLPALERLARIHLARGNLDDARRHLDRVVALEREPVAALLQLGSLSMARQDTVAAIDYYERALELQGDEFESFLDLGVLYLANRQFREAAAALDRVAPTHPAWPLALFKRAQVAVLLEEPDMRERVWQAESEADEMTRELIANEQLFRGITRQ